MSWEVLAGATTGAVLGIIVAKVELRRLHGRRYRLQLIRAAVSSVRRIPDMPEALVLWADQREIIDMTPKRQRFDRWHAEMVLEAIRRRCKAIERRMLREALDPGPGW